jgi:hypothetical protein
MDQLAFAGLLLLGLGIGGPGMIFAALFSRPSTLFAGGLLAAAHLLVAFAVIRGTRLNWYSSRTPLAVGWVAVLTLAALVVAVQASGAPILWPAYMFEYALLAILGAIGLTAGWMTRQAESGRRKAEGGKRKPVRPPTSGLRWLRAGFYLEEVFLLAVVLPLRAAAQLCRFFEWFIIERLWELPRRATEWLGGLGEPLQGGTVRLSVAAILLATAALLGVIVGW